VPERLKAAVAQLENLYKQVGDAHAELKRPFSQEAELAEKEARLAILNVELNIDGRTQGVIDCDAPGCGAVTRQGELAISAKAERPSILEGLRSGVYGGIDVRPDCCANGTKPNELSV